MESSQRRQQRPGDQPPPTSGNGSSIVALVIADILERRRLGIQRYGMELQAWNGRDALLDAYQECLDMCGYLKQKLVEQEQQRNTG